MALIPIFVVAWYLAPWWASFALFVLASLSDKLDGYVARKYNQITNFGKFVDPLADKLLVSAALLLFVAEGRIGAVAALIIIGREFIVTSLRVVAMSEGRVLAASTSGKIKMVVQVVGLALMMIEPVFEVAGSFGSTALLGAFTVHDLIVWLIAAVTLWSGAEYCIKNRDVISNY